MIARLKVVNFKSFIGENEAELSNFCGIISTLDSGVEDLRAALEYAFGAELNELGCDHPNDLFHDCWTSKSEFPELMVGITVKHRTEALCKFTRSVINSSEVYEINDEKVTLAQYKRLLLRLGYQTTVCNRFYFSLTDFFNAMLEEDGLEEIISSSLGFNSNFHEIVKRKEMFHSMNQAIKMLEEKDEDLNPLKVVEESEEFNEYQSLVQKKILRDEAFLEEFRKKIKAEDKEVEGAALILPAGDLPLPPFDDDAMDVYGSDESVMPVREGAGGVIGDSAEEFSSSEYGEQMVERDGGGVIGDSAEESSFSGETEELYQYTCDLRREENILETVIFHHQVRDAHKRKDIEFLLALKSEILEKKRDAAEKIRTWPEERALLDEKLEDVSKCIGSDLSELNYLRTHRDIRLSGYGRISDRIQFGDYEWIVAALLGTCPSQVHIVDNTEAAVQFMKLIWEKGVENRHTFLPLLDPRLRNLLFEFGKNVVRLSSVPEVLELCAKMKDLGVIACKLQIYREGGIPDDLPEVEEDTLAFFLETGEFLSGDGTFGRVEKFVEKPCFENIAGTSNCIYAYRMTEEQIIEDLRKLTVEKIHFQRQLELLEAYERIVSKKIEQASLEAPPLIHWKMQLDPIYEEYAEEFAGVREPCLEETSPLVFPEANEPRPEVQEELERWYQERSAISEGLLNLEERLNERMDRERRDELFYLALEESSVVRRPYIQEDPPFNEINCAESLYTEEFIADMKWYLENRDWLFLLTEHIQVEEKNLNKFKKGIDAMLNERRDNLLPVMDYCNEFLQNLDMHFGEVLEGAKLFCSAMAPVNIIVRTLNYMFPGRCCNSFIRCVTYLAVFIRLVSFKKMPFLLLDDIEPFCPRSDEDVPPVLGVDSLNSEFMRTNLMVLLGQFLQMALYFESLESHRESSPEENTLSPTGLDQILIRTNDDISFCTDSTLLIWAQNFEDSSHPGKVMQATKFKMIFSNGDADTSSNSDR